MRRDDAGKAHRGVLQLEARSENLAHGRGRERNAAGARIDRPDQVGGSRPEKPGEFRHIGSLTLLIETMKAAHIERSVE
jgi:hypothetical protein